MGGPTSSEHFQSLDMLFSCCDSRSLHPPFRGRVCVHALRNTGDPTLIHPVDIVGLSLLDLCVLAASNVSLLCRVAFVIVSRVAVAGGRAPIIVLTAVGFITKWSRR